MLLAGVGRMAESLTVTVTQRREIVENCKKCVKSGKKFAKMRAFWTEIGFDWLCFLLALFIVICS